MRAAPAYVQIDLQSLTLAHLQDCTEQLAICARVPIQLLFAARSAHSALVTALTAASAGSASIGAFHPKEQEKWLRFFEDLRNGTAEAPVRDHVMPPKALLRVARQEAIGYFNEPLEIDMVDEYRLGVLIWLRGRVEHPRAEGLSIEPVMIADAVDVGASLTVRCLQPVWHHFEESQQALASEYVRRIRNQCSAIVGIGR